MSRPPVSTAFLQVPGCFFVAPTDEAPRSRLPRWRLCAVFARLPHAPSAPDIPRSWCASAGKSPAPTSRSSRLSRPARPACSSRPSRRSTGPSRTRCFPWARPPSRGTAGGTLRAGVRLRGGSPPMGERGGRHAAAPYAGGSLALCSPGPGRATGVPPPVLFFFLLLFARLQVLACGPVAVGGCVPRSPPVGPNRARDFPARIDGVACSPHPWPRAPAHAEWRV